MKIVSKSRTRLEETPANFPKCLCGGSYEIVSHYGPRGSLKNTSAECLECNEVFTGKNLNNLSKLIKERIS